MTVYSSVRVTGTVRVKVQCRVKAGGRVTIVPHPYLWLGIR